MHENPFEHVASFDIMSYIGITAFKPTIQIKEKVDNASTSKITDAGNNFVQ